MKIISILLSNALLTTSVFASTWSIDESNQRIDLLANELSLFNINLPTAIKHQKYTKMASSPFVFFRGSAHLYYRDLAAKQLINKSYFFHINAKTWIQGDLHTENYGSFDNDQGRIIYDLNDFDESWVTSYLYDVWRASISIALVAKQNNFSDEHTETFINAFSESYLDQLADFSDNNNEKDFYIDKKNAYGKLDDFLEEIQDKKSRSKLLNKWTIATDNLRQFKSNDEQPKLDHVSEPDMNELKSALAIYQQTLSSDLKNKPNYFLVKDIAKRLDAGTGSLGTSRFYALIEGESSSNQDDRILDIKNQGLPSVYPYLSTEEKNRLQDFSNSMGCRVITAQKALLNHADDHLGCLAAFNESYSVRELSPFKESFDTTILNSETRFKKLAEQWGKILAAAHARADQDFKSQYVCYNFDELISQLTDGKHKEFRQEVRDVAINYAKQVRTDYNFFLNLFQEGKLED